MGDFFGGLDTIYGSEDEHVSEDKARKLAAVMFAATAPDKYDGTRDEADYLPYARALVEAAEVLRDSALDCLCGRADMDERGEIGGPGCKGNNILDTPRPLGIQSRPTERFPSLPQGQR